MATNNPFSNLELPADPSANHTVAGRVFSVGLYLGTAAIVAAGSILIIIYANGTLALSPPVQLGLWVVGVAGVASAPAAGRSVMRRWDTWLASSTTPMTGQRSVDPDDTTSTIAATVFTLTKRW